MSPQRDSADGKENKNRHLLHNYKSFNTVLVRAGESQQP